VTAQMSHQKQEALGHQMNSNIWQAIHQTEQIQIKSQHKKTWLRWVAAAAVVLMICSVELFILLKKPEQPQQVAHTSNTAKQHRVVCLPDGSTVIVNAGSKLNYPSTFKGQARREVYLEGQAYFDIRHNEAQPFIVHTGSVETTVLGTAFNIKAWAAEGSITVTVTRGRVKVGDKQKIFGVITPNQQIVYSKTEDKALKKGVDANAYLAWKNDDLIFDDVTVGEASKLLEERFNVKITIADQEIKSGRFTTTFLKKENLKEVLESICEFTGAKFDYNKDKATVVISNK